MSAIVTHPPAQGVPFWDPERDEVLVCRQVRDETHDVRTFVFTAPQARLFSYAPGQFMTLTVMIDGQEINRCYTISSSPTRPNTLEITIKRVPGGVVSNWLHDNLHPGMEVRALGPMGDFTCAGSRARKMLFLSGGSGITPMMSMSRALSDMAADVDIMFVHAARSPRDRIFRHELAALEQANAHLRTVTLCEHDTPADRWDGYRGRLSASALELAVPDWREREVFVCGPAPFMDAVRNMLGQGGFDMTRHHEESFDFGTLVADEPEIIEAIEELEAAQFSISFTKSQRDIQCGADTPVLSAARAAGMRLPASCAKGMCGTCKCRLVSGTVEMKHDGGIRQREIDRGMILLCCAKPTSDLVIER
ncbi:3-ketosteroid-9-alpha-hydroxylase reductase subunit [Komagataeibacter saccharivorans]|uniref:3-ketosteroid-9-alpha-hydroxylase reductase subunit n=1 Tax=Komagataeibacter saccharivorans TaxID=265959 RepID=A0A347WFA3_9PROT|nr:hybrid-cluster NAD(P)-dependent oxidoreductase [Komagataeibacter saccharivorans]AXY23546.1 3-ketosteroid-9-alpha-hydroxylase reductase subunit [Komagataeibacter saccharivorans]